MEPGQKAELSGKTYQLTEQYQIGQPLALYHMPLRWIRFLQVIDSVLLGLVICAMLFLLIVFALFLSQLIEGQFADLQERVMLGLPGIIMGLIGCVECLMIRLILARELPASLLVCTEGLLVIRPKKLEATRWDEVKGTLQRLELGKKNSFYYLDRLDREPLKFRETAFENVESLTDLIRQQIQR